MPSAFLLILATAARPGEVVGARWSEFDGDVWTAPAERSKGGREIRRPLSSWAKAILAQVGYLAGGDFAPWSHVFPARRTSVGFAAAWKRWMLSLGYESEEAPRPHDLRRTARSLLARLGVRLEVAESLLDHRMPGTVDVYARYGYEPEKRQALEDLAAEVRRLVEVGGEDLVGTADEDL